MAQFSVIKLGQNGKDLFLTSISGREMRSLNVRVDAWGVFTGYQRVKLRRKANKIATYLRDIKGLMPTSILIAIRSDHVRYREVEGNRGVLTFPDRAVVFIVDGQHRAKGLEIAADEDDTLADFSFPAVILCPSLWAGGYNSALEESKQFITINKTQSPVPRELVDVVLSKVNFLDQTDPARAHESMPDDIYNEMRIRSRSLGIVRWLNDRQVWRGLIRIANAEKGKTTVNQTVMVDTIVKELLKNPPYDAFDDSIIQERLYNYWKAILARYSRAKRNPQKYFVQRRLGVSVFHHIFPKVDRYTASPKGQQQYSNSLDGFHMADEEDFWGPRGRASVIGESFKTVKRVSNQIGARYRS